MIGNTESCPHTILDNWMKGNVAKRTGENTRDLIQGFIHIIIYQISLQLKFP